MAGSKRGHKMEFNSLDAKEALEFLVDEQQFSWDRKSGLSETDLVDHDLGPKIEYWYKMTTCLLPQIKDQTNSLPLSLGLHDLKRHPNPDFELTIDLSVRLNQSLEAAIAGIKYIALESPLPPRTQDHSIGPYKNFRCSHLLNRITSVVDEDLCPLYRTCIQFIQAWEASSSDPDNSEYQANIINKANEVLKLTDHSSRLIDKIVDLIPLSDFRFLQDDWLTEAEALSPVLEILTNLTNPLMKWKLELDPVDDADGQKNREHVVEVARSTIPLFKLTRTLLYRISTANTDKMPFRLDVELSSGTLDQLLLGPVSIAQTVGSFVYTLEELHSRNLTIGDENKVRSTFNDLSETVDSCLNDLNHFLIPLDSSISDHSPENEFNAWTRVFKDSWRDATHLVVGVIFPESENLPTIEQQY